MLPFGLFDVYTNQLKTFETLAYKRFVVSRREETKRDILNLRRRNLITNFNLFVACSCLFSQLRSQMSKNNNEKLTHYIVWILRSADFDINPPFSKMQQISHGLVRTSQKNHLGFVFLKKQQSCWYRIFTVMSVQDLFYVSILALCMFYKIEEKTITA